MWHLAAYRQPSHPVALNSPHWQLVLLKSPLRHLNRTQTSKCHRVVSQHVVASANPPAAPDTCQGSDKRHEQDEEYCPLVGIHPRRRLGRDSQVAGIRLRSEGGDSPSVKVVLDLPRDVLGVVARILSQQTIGNLILVDGVKSSAHHLKIPAIQVGFPFNPGEGPNI